VPKGPVNLSGLQQNGWRAEPLLASARNLDRTRRSPQAVSVSLSADFGSSKMFSFVIFDANGASDRNTVQMLFDGAFSGSHAC
jgi:hypothetical protein